MDYYTFGCVFISLIGLAVRIYTIDYTPDNTSGRNTSEQVADTLNRTGIYSIIRHPLYVGIFLMWLGIAFVVQNFWFIGQLVRGSRNYNYTLYIICLISIVLYFALRYMKKRDAMVERIQSTPYYIAVLKICFIFVLVFLSKKR
jgi:hypothetical protein